MGFALLVGMTVRTNRVARLRVGCAAAWRFLRQWAWTPILRRALVWLIAFAALAYVGSGAAARLLGAPGGPDAGWPPAAALAAGRPALAPAEATHVPDLRSPPSAAASSQSVAAAASPGVTPDGKVILNRASADDLVRLPGIGPKRAQAIIAMRQRLGGRFQRVRDLLRIRGIGYRTLQRIKPLVVLDPPPAKDEG